MAAYANAKGAAGEREFAEFLTRALAKFGYTFTRVGGVEKSKVIFGGDVILSPKSTNRDGDCVVAEYYLESKKHAHPSVYAIFRKAEDDARWWNKKGSISYVTKQARGEKGERIIVMSPETFEKILVELQGFRYEQYIKSREGTSATQAVS